MLEVASQVLVDVEMRRRVSVQLPTRTGGEPGSERGACGCASADASDGVGGGGLDAQGGERPPRLRHASNATVRGPCAARAIDPWHGPKRRPWHSTERVGWMTETEPPTAVPQHPWKTDWAGWRFVWFWSGSSWCTDGSSSPLPPLPKPIAHHCPPLPTTARHCPPLRRLAHLCSAHRIRRQGTVGNPATSGSGGYGG